MKGDATVSLPKSDFGYSGTTGSGQGSGRLWRRFSIPCITWTSRHWAPPSRCPPNTRPYQAIPFQWSNHIEAADGTVRHEAYLCPDERDPREDLALALLKSLGRNGSICTYTRYERSVLTALAAALSRLRRDLLRVCDRLWDLHPIIKAHYYHPGFAGSYSIKSVLPALVPRLAYDDLEIQEGTMASLQFHRMIFEDVDAVEKARIRTALLKYCERDTLAMVEIRKTLRAKVMIGTKSGRARRSRTMGRVLQ
jgi:hypothetical protein